MEEYSPKYISLLIDKGYSVEELPYYIDARVRNEIDNINRLLNKYEVHASKGQSKIANDLLERIEQIDDMICTIIRQHIESEEELEEQEKPNKQFEDFYFLIKELYEKGEKKIKKDLVEEYGISLNSKINLITKNNISFSLFKEKDYYIIKKYENK